MNKIKSKKTDFSIVQAGVWAMVALWIMIPAQAFAQAAPTPATGGSCTAGTLGGMVCNFLNGTSTLPGIFAGLAYTCGLICGFLAIMKLRDHVENPNSVPIWDPIKRFLAGGAFLATPMIVDAVITTIQGPGASYTTSGGNVARTAGGSGLDAMIVQLVGNLMSPTIFAASWVAWLAAFVFVFIGISRLLKSEQEGPRGPTGIGTFTTFMIAGALFSINSIVTFLNGTLFGNTTITPQGTLQYTAGLGTSVTHVHAVISAIIGFAVIIGWISVVRGLFIVRGVAEGNSQASMMAGITHLIGGALAINLGAVIMAVQNTLGITNYGIIFN